MRFYVALNIFCVMLVWASTLYVATVTQAGPFDKLVPKGVPNPFKPGDFEKQAQDYLRDQLGKVLGEQAPFVIDPNTAFQQVPADRIPAPNNFKPTELKNVSDLNRPLPPGDYSFHAMFYCTQWSVHRPGRGHPYTMGRAQGRLAKQMSALLYRGTVKHIAPSIMNAMAWRVQAGVPLSQWPDGEKSLVHELVPEYEKDLQGDWLQKIEGNYNKTFRLATHKSFNDELKTLDGLGDLAMRLEAAHQTLSDTKVVDERLPDLMFQQFGAGGSPQLPDDPNHPSPWMSVSPGVMARFTVYDGNLGDNLMEMHITQEAGNNGKEPTISGIENGADDGDNTGLVGYSPDSQSPLIEPTVTDDGNDYQEPNLCPSAKLMANRSPQEQDKLRKLYNEALGVKQRLRKYRDDFMNTLNPDDVFPTFYYHTTVNGLNEINQGNLNHPDTALEEIIEFYSAYESNRNPGTREKHWNAYYVKANHLKDIGMGSWSIANFFDMFDSNGLLSLGADAHIDSDLPRALHDVLRRNTEANGNHYGIEELRNDFYSFDDLFSQTSREGFQDVSVALSKNDGAMALRVGTDVDGWLGRDLIGGYLATKQRHKAWLEAEQGNLPAGLEKPQPPSDDNDLEAEGKKSCPENQ